MISLPDALTATASGVHAISSSVRRMGVTLPAYPPHDLIPLIATARLEPFDDDRTRDAKAARALLEL